MKNFPEGTVDIPLNQMSKNYSFVVFYSLNTSPQKDALCGGSQRLLSQPNCNFSFF
jgi:hypothetical protein